MLPSPNFNANVLPAIHPAAIVDDDDFDSLVIDLADSAVRGAQFLLFVLHVGAIDAAMATLKVMESDTKSNDTTLGGTAAEVLDVETKPGSDDDDSIWLVSVDLRAPRKRYLQLQASAGDGASGTFASATAFAVSPAEIRDNNNAAEHATG